MNAIRFSRLCTVTALAFFSAHMGWDNGGYAQDPAEPAKGAEVLTRGPVHEAFAETVIYDPQPGIVAPKTPPHAIEELPPDQKPEGAHVAWIPGYWAWDEERNDFLWVSGTWRALPPGRQWVPGYWSPSDQGSQWTSGYWADAEQGEVQYLPEPPATVEAGPNEAATSADQIWVPGSWVWNQNRYVWQPGYWTPGQQNWVWTPSHYQWSPRGYVFVNGYYDYSLARRGVLFAPVYFQPGTYAQQGFAYSPAMAISMAVFGNQLFVRPNYGHYYFGDYYGSSSSSSGYYPWYSFNSGRSGYDPFYAHQAWQNRANPAWANTVQTNFQNRVDREELRPPRTLADQQARLKSGDQSGGKSVATAIPLDQLARTKDSALRLQPVTREEQQTLAKHGQAVQQFRGQRQKLEAGDATASTEKPARELEPATVKLPRSPILATSSDKLAKDHIPPKSHQVPAYDPKIEPKPRPAVAKGPSTKTEPTTVKTPKTVVPPGKPKVPAGELKIESNLVPKPAPKPEAPQVEPPNSESRPAPKNAPKPLPKAEPKPVAPQPEPKPKAK